MVPSYSTTQSCLKNAQSLYNQTGYISSLTRGWYIWSDASGDIDSRPTGGLHERVLARVLWQLRLGGLRRHQWESLAASRHTREGSDRLLH